MNIHPSAVIDPKAVLGRDVTVGPFAFIDESVEIGEGCVIGPHAAILRHVTMGEGNRVHAGAVIGDLPQDLAFKGEPSYVKIGRRNTFREGLTIHRGTKPGTTTEIGDDCFLMGHVHVAHNCKLGNRVIAVNGAVFGGYVEVGDRAFFSAHVMVHQFVKIGGGAMVGGAAGLSKDVPPYCLVQSMARNSVQGLNVVGARRAGLSAEDRRQVKEAFKMLYLSELNVSQALERMKVLFTSGPAAEFTTFVEHSKRGICRYSGSRGSEADESDAE